MTHLLEEFLCQREPLYKVYERDMLQLVLSISKKIIRHELQSNEEVVLSTLQEAFKQIVDQRKVRIRVNPVDFQFLHTHSDRWSLRKRSGMGSN